MEGADKVQKHRGERDTHGLRSHVAAPARAPPRVRVGPRAIAREDFIRPGRQSRGQSSGGGVRVMWG
jgi:hypothetical protein